MRLNLLVLLIAVGILPAIAQDKLTEVDLTVNGIRSGSTIQQVQKLGKPIRVKSLGHNDCSDSFERTFILSGLKIGLLGSKNGRQGIVYSLEVTSRKWKIEPGLRIGAKRETVLRKYGRPVAVENGSLVYVTKNNLGMVGFHFHNGRLIRAEMMETLC